jgi:hypothetical protein
VTDDVHFVFLPACRQVSKQANLTELFETMNCWSFDCILSADKIFLMIETQISFVSAANLHEFLQSSWCMQVTVPFMSVLTPERKCEN